AKSLFIESIPMLYGFPKVFPTDLLGHAVSKEGMMVDPKNIHTFKNWVWPSFLTKHWGKANMVEDKLSRKTVSMDNLACFGISKCPFAKEIQTLDSKFMWLGISEKEAHGSPYSIHPGVTKMYRYLRQLYWWNGKTLQNMFPSSRIVNRVDNDSQRLAKIYLKEIVRLHVVPLSIISDCVTLMFWGKLHETLGTQLTCNTTFHPQTDGQSTRTIKGKGYKPTIDWFEVGDVNPLSVDLARKDQERVGDQVLLKVSPMKGAMRFGKKGNLSPRYIGPFKVLEGVRPVACMLALPPNLSGVHPVFDVSMLKKGHGDGDYIIKWDSIVLDKDLRYEEELIVILGQNVRKLRTKEIKSKVY
ncbi:hypothetical protein MTR67_039037, partial [Solanum verrucosum]